MHNEKVSHIRNAFNEERRKHGVSERNLFEIELADSGRWGKNKKILAGDFHLHTTCSDALGHPLEMFFTAMRASLDFAGVTDHDFVRGKEVDALKLASEYKLPLLTIRGKEITAPWGHILALDMEDDITQDGSPEQICKRIRRHGGYAFAAHPLWAPCKEFFWDQGIFEKLIRSRNIDGYELVNPVVSFKDNRALFEKYRNDRKHGKSMPITGGTDAHHPDGLGRVRTFVFVDRRDEKAVLAAALRQRAVIAWEGKFFGPAPYAEKIRALSKKLFPMRAILLRNFLQLTVPRTELIMGQAAEVEIKLCNVFDFPVAGRAELTLPAGWRIEPPGSLLFELKPDETISRQFTMTIPYSAREGINGIGVKVMVGKGDGKNPEEIYAGEIIKVLRPLAIKIRPGIRAGVSASSPLLAVEVKNRQAGLICGKIKIKGPAGWAIRPGRIKKLKPGKTVTINCKIGSRNPIRPDKRYNLRTKVKLAEKKYFFQNDQIDFLTCSKAAEPPRIDGNLEEWEKAAPIHLDKAEQVRLKKWGGKSDLSACVYTMWDEDNFYIAARVADDHFYQPFSDDRMWQGDCLVFGIDPLWTRKPIYGDVYELTMALTPSGPKVLRGASPRIANKTSGEIETARSAIIKTGTGLIYEAAIPIKELYPLAPKVGKSIGFALLVNDNDTGGCSGWIDWAGDIRRSKTPSSWGILTFVDGTLKK